MSKKVVWKSRTWVLFATAWASQCKPKDVQKWLVAGFSSVLQSCQASPGVLSCFRRFPNPARNMGNFCWQRSGLWLLDRPTPSAADHQTLTPCRDTPCCLGCGSGSPYHVWDGPFSYFPHTVGVCRALPDWLHFQHAEVALCQSQWPFRWSRPPFYPNPGCHRQSETVFITHSYRLWKRVWYVRGLPWKPVGKLGSRNHSQSDLLRSPPYMVCIGSDVCICLPLIARYPIWGCGLI